MWPVVKQFSFLCDKQSKHQVTCELGKLRWQQKQQLSWGMSR